MNKYFLRYFTSLFMLLILVGLVGYLTFIPVPTSNRDLIITVLSVLLGAGTSALPNLFGDDNTESAKLREQMNELRREMHEKDAAHEVAMADLSARAETIRAQYDSIVKMLVERHVVQGVGITVVDE